MNFQSRRVRVIAGVVVGAFAVTSLLRFWVHPSGWHTWRQAVTISMSMSFAEELRTRGLAALDFLLYPKVLERGLLDGINASEFPLLNVLTGPLYLISPWMGVFLSSLLILAFNLITSYVALPRLLRHFKMEIPPHLAMLLWFSAETAAYQSNVVMPEGVALPLMVWAVLLILEGRRFWAGILLANLAIAVKPTAVIALLVVVMGAVATFSARKDPGTGPRFWRPLMALPLSVLLGAWWYTLHSKQILSFAQGPQVFITASLDPFTRLSEVGPGGLLHLMAREIFKGQFPMFVGGIFFALALVYREWIWIGAYFISLIAAISLDGPHIYAHAYYFMSSSIFAWILIARVISKSAARPRTPKWLNPALFAVLCWGVIFNTRTNVWIWARDSDYFRVDPWKMGSLVSEKVPLNYHLVTDDGSYAEKLLYIGRIGTIAHISKFPIEQICLQPAYRNMPLAVVTSKGGDQLAGCEGRAQKRISIRTSSADWRLVLIEPEPPA